MSPRSGPRPQGAGHRPGGANTHKPNGDDPAPAGARTRVWWRRGTTWTALVVTVSAASWWIAHINPPG